MNPPDEAGSPQGQPPRAMVFLVHGTFAPSAEWCQKGSRFRKMLTKAVPGIEFGALPDWSGANTTAARNDGISDLRQRLTQSLNDRRDVPHFVIGHSHGGLIALNTVATERLLDKVGVACLATPFLHGRRRRASEWLAFGFFTGALLATIAFTTTVFVVMQRLDLLSVHDLDVVAKYFPVALLVLFVIVALLGRRRSTLRTDAFLKQNTFLLRPPHNLLFVATEGDEASAFLTTFQFCTWLVNKCITLVEGLMHSFVLWLRVSARKPLSARNIIPVALMYGGGLASVVFLITHADTGSFRLPTWLATSLVILGAIALTVSMFTKRRAVLSAAKLFYGTFFSLVFSFPCALLIPCWLSAAFLLYPMRDMILCCLTMDISIQAVPEGKWTLHQFVPRAALRGIVPAHSAPHDDPRVINLIANWIAGSIAQPVGTPNQEPESNRGLGMAASDNAT